jgi:uncharacterized coiled-coil DUF342 family protein
MTEIEKLKVEAYDLMFRIQNDQNQLQLIHNKIAELSTQTEQPTT